MGVPQYGLLGHGILYGKPFFGLKLRPHVAMRAKRFFPRLEQNQRGLLILGDTPDVAADLNAFMTRFPLEMTEATAARLAARLAEHRATEEHVAEILTGHVRPDEWKPAAREPRDYQRQAAQLVHAVKRTIIGDDVGLGKSQAALMVLRDPESLPALLVVPTNLPQQWLDELNEVLPWLLGHIITGTRPYDPATKRDCAGRDPDVLITTYSKLAGWGDHLAGKIRTVVFDEVQDLRRGTGTAKGAAAAMIAGEALYAFGLSATPLYNYGDEAWKIYDIIAPGALGTYDEFTREWRGSQHGLERHVKIADPKALGDYLRSQGLLLRRTRKDVGREIREPLLITQPVDTDRSVVDQVAGDVTEMARLLLDKTSDPKERWRAASEIDWRLRQATGVAKARYVAEFVRLLLESEEKVVLFGWHRDVYDLWLRRLAEFKPVMYTGSESPKRKTESVREFVEGDARVFIMSLRSGAGLDGLQKAASVAVFGELDWSPKMHHQCVGRLWRDGQNGPVVAYYMLSDDGTDPVMADVLELKHQQTEPIMNPEKAQTIIPVEVSEDRAKRLAADVLGRAGGLAPQKETLPLG